MKMTPLSSKWHDSTQRENISDFVASMAAILEKWRPFWIFRDTKMFLHDLAFLETMKMTPISSKLLYQNLRYWISGIHGLSGGHLGYWRPFWKRQVAIKLTPGGFWNVEGMHIQNMQKYVKNCFVPNNAKCYVSMTWKQDYLSGHTRQFWVRYENVLFFKVSCKISYSRHHFHKVKVLPFGCGQHMIETWEGHISANLLQVL